MKKIVISVFFVLLMFLIPFGCQKDELTDNKDPGILKAGYTMTESLVKPKFGKPNSTYYYFQVGDISGINALSVKLYERVTGTITYLPMTRSGTLWVLSTKISKNGWYDWRYVYSVTKANISSNSYALCNTYNVFSSTGTSYLTWPFGADGSSWTKRTVLINGVSQKWIDGNEDGKGYGGFGWEEGTHSKDDITERYSVDWNRGIGSQDLGAELRSPLDGTVAYYGTYSTSLGQSKFVAVIQESSDGRTYRFYFGHMKEIDSGIYNGKPVRAGITKLGTLGMTGASSPHAHASLREVTNGLNNSVRFYFNAQGR